MADPNRPLWQWSACELADAIAARKVTAADAVGTAVARMRATNGKINAVVNDLGETALREAEAHDKVMSAGGPIGPLHGVPITIKENVDQKGCATPNGVVAFKDVIAPDDAPVVRNLRRAGAIIIGRTNTPEFSFRGTTVNELHGRTWNPWNATASAGGSSGGAAAAVMMGYGPIAHGNDIGGSLRWPAHCNGVVTIKPTQFDDLAARAKTAGVPIRRIGVTHGNALTLPGERAILLDALRERHEGWLPGYMAGGAN